MTGAVEAQAPETVEIADLDQLVKLLTGWHSQKVAVLEHMIDLPEGTEMSVGDSPESIVMTGDMLAGFKAGLGLALIELGTLPFLCEEPTTANGA